MLYEGRQRSPADRITLARVRDRINSDRFAIRTDLQAMAADERRLEELRANAAHAKALIESSRRATHFG